MIRFKYKEGFGVKGSWSSGSFFRVFIFLFFVFCVAPCFSREKTKPWTFCHLKTFTTYPLVDGSRAFIKTDIQEGNEFVVCFNADRPSSGYFVFSLRVRDEKTGKWGPWYKMYEWGRGVQRSFHEKHADGVYDCVRLDLKKGKLADGFWLKVESIGGADVRNIKMLSVCVSDLKKFVPERHRKRYRDCAPVYVEGVPSWSQMVLEHPRVKSICSPTSLSMVLTYLLKKNLDPVLFAAGVRDQKLDIFGNWVFNMAHAYEVCPLYRFDVRRLHSFATLYHLLRQGNPVVVSVRGRLRGAPRSYPAGHLLVVVGFDLRHVICHDPAALSVGEVVRLYDLEDFLAAWECSRRLAYVISDAYSAKGW